MLTTILVIVNILLIVMVFWKLAKDDKFFTTIESGNEKFVVRGATYAKTISENSSSLLKGFGLFWVGIYPLNQIKEFSILIDVENPQAKEVEGWVKKLGEKRKVKSLRRLIPRPLIMRDTELELGKSTVDILVSLIFRVVDGKKFVFDMKADFAPVMSVIQTEIINILKGVGLDQFLNTHAGDETHASDETSDLLSSLVSNTFNQRLETLFGLRLESAGISNFQISDLKLRKAREAEQVAILEGTATQATATAEANAAFTKAQKEAEGITVIGEARNAVLTSTVTALKDLSEPAAQFLSTDKMADAMKVTGLSALVLGNSAVNLQLNTTPKEGKK